MAYAQLEGPICKFQAPVHTTPSNTTHRWREGVPLYNWLLHFIVVL